MRKYAAGFFPGFVLGACAVLGCATAFPYHYYNQSMPDSCYDNGSLLGKSGSDGWPDLTLDHCKPDPSPSPGESTKPVLDKCITMDIKDFYSMQADYEQCHKDLEICKQGQPPNSIR